MEDREIAQLKADGITLFDALGQPITREEMLVTWNSEAAEKGGFEHFHDERNTRGTSRRSRYNHAAHP